MKLALALSALASVASVCAESIYFVASNEDKSIDFPLASHRVGAGTNYFMESTHGEVFNLENGVASKQYGNFLGHVGVLPGLWFAAGPAITPVAFTFEDDVISNYVFFACKDLDDPNNIFKDNYAILAHVKSSVVISIEKCTSVTVSKHAASSSASA